MSTRYVQLFAVLLTVPLLLSTSVAHAGGGYDDALTAYYTKDYATALRLYRALAAKGDTRAQRDIARMYRKGEGVPKDADEAAKWQKMADEQEDALISYNHGDFETALRVFRPLADKGQVMAEYILGLMYANGHGVPESYPEGLKWLTKAAEQGEAKAQFSVGVIYFKGLGIPKNEAEALKWYKRSADQGYATAQYNLAAMYAKGQAVAQDVVTAHVLYSLAAKHGIKAAAAARDRLVKSMTAEQTGRAEQMAKDWKPKLEVN